MNYIEVTEVEEYYNIQDGVWDFSPFEYKEVQEHQFKNLIEFKKYIERHFAFEVTDLKNIRENELEIVYERGKNIGIRRSFYFMEIKRTEYKVKDIDWVNLK